MKNCKWCNDVVKYNNSDECDRCWDLRWQCEVVPELVAKILSASNTASTRLVESGGTLPAESVKVENALPAESG